MKEKVYVDRLFAEYENTKEIRDFKEEVAANLRERVQDFLKSGLDADEAFDKATEELGDITQIVDHMSQQKQSEMADQVNDQGGAKTSKKHAAGFAIGVLLLIIGILGVSAYIFGFPIKIYSTLTIVLLTVAVGMLTYFGLTQETRANVPMNAKRAIIYGVVGAGLTLGVATSLILYLTNNDLSFVITVLLAFIVPFSGLLIFMVLTEKKRHKPWMRSYIEAENNRADTLDAFADPVKAVRFGLASAALWTFAFALFLTIGLYNGWKHSWLVLLFAIPIHLLLLMVIYTRKK